MPNATAKPQSMQITDGYKSAPVEVVEKWKFSAPYRKNDCMEIAKRLEELSNENIDANGKLSQAINIIYNKLDLCYLLIYCAKDDWIILCTGAGKGTQRMLERGPEKRKIELDKGFATQVAFTQKLHRFWDITPNEPNSYFIGPDLGETKSAISFPLLVGKIIGVMELGSMLRCDFREEEYDSFQLLADCVAKILAQKL